MAKPKKKTTTEQALARMKSANQKLKTQLNNESEFDISLVPTSWWRKNWKDKKIQKLFIENFIYIRSGKDENELVLFKFNDVQEDLHFNSTGHDATLKARQQGVTTYYLAKKYAKATLFSGRNIRLVPHDPEAEEEFWSRLDTMHQNMASHLKTDTKYYSKELMHFEDGSKGVTDSRISCLLPNPTKRKKGGKGRSQTLTDLHLTEVPFWAGDQRITLTGLLTAAQHGEVSIESTAGGLEWFYKTYTDAKKGKNKYRAHFYEWWWTREYRIEGSRIEKARNREWVLLLPSQRLKDIWQVPNRKLSEGERAEKRNIFDAAKLSLEEMKLALLILRHLQKKGYAPKSAKWNCKQVAEYLAWRREKIKDIGESDFKVEYPSNDKDCFENTGRTVISPKDAVVTCQPEEPIDGEEYLVAVDTSLGKPTSDPAAIEVINLRTGRQCYSEECLLAPDLLAYRVAEISDFYNDAKIAVENNNTGLACINKLLELVEPERIYKELTKAEQRAVDDGKKTLEEALDEASYGITTTTANKGLMGVLLERAIRTGEIGLSNQDWCDQSHTVVWKDNNTWAALSGFHDDRFMALAIANYVRLQAMSMYQEPLGILPEIGDAR
jgi:hypothetical protein